MYGSLLVHLLGTLVKLNILKWHGNDSPSDYGSVTKIAEINVVTPHLLKHTDIHVLNNLNGVLF